MLGSLLLWVGFVELIIEMTLNVKIKSSFIEKCFIVLFLIQKKKGIRIIADY